MVCGGRGGEWRADWDRGDDELQGIRGVEVRGGVSGEGGGTR